MAEYKSSLYAISNRWTQKGQGEEMEVASRKLCKSTGRTRGGGSLPTVVTDEGREDHPWTNGP